MKEYMSVKARSWEVKWACPRAASVVLSMLSAAHSAAASCCWLVITVEQVRDAIRSSNPKKAKGSDHIGILSRTCSMLLRIAVAGRGN